MSFNVENYYNELRTDNAIFSFKGNITADLINDFLETIEDKLVEEEENPRLQKKIYNVLVESLQNLYHHIDELPGEIIDEFGDRFCIFLLSKTDDKYQITTGNFITEEKSEFLKEKIDKINSLSQEEIKEMYKFILNHQKLSAKGGGGLGFVDIAKKTKNKMDYFFHKYKNNYYFYVLNIYIN
jgi:hypothetical protein